MKCGLLYRTLRIGPSGAIPAPELRKEKRDDDEASCAGAEGGAVATTYRVFAALTQFDGREKVPGHGGPDMPVWGDAFLRTSDTSDEASVKHRIGALVDYLETLQVRNTQ